MLLAPFATLMVSGAAYVATYAAIWYIRFAWNRRPQLAIVNSESLIPNPSSLTPNP